MNGDWRDWTPANPCAQLIGTCSDELRGVFGDRTEVRQVYAALETIAHYQNRHKAQFNIEKVTTLLAKIIERPEAIYIGLKSNTLVFMGSYDIEYLLIVPVKVLKQEMWLESVFITNAVRFQKRAWVQKGLIYEK